MAEKTLTQLMDERRSLQEKLDQVSYGNEIGEYQTFSGSARRKIQDDLANLNAQINNFSYTSSSGSTGGSTNNGGSLEVGGISETTPVTSTNNGVPLPNERTQQVGEAVQLNLTDPQIPESAIQTATDIEVQPDEITDPTDPRFQADTAIGSGADAAQGTAAIEEGPAALESSQMEAAMAGDAAQATAATDTGPATEAVAAQQDGLSQQAEAAVSQLPPEFLTSGQLAQLLTTENPEDIPAFARPAVAAVERMLAARGISRSSIGAEQLTNTLIQSALPIAQANANALQANFESNLNRQQQVNVLNAQLGAQLDLANLNNRQQTALFNAQQSQQLRLANLSNEQQASILNAQLRQQTMLSDQAAENAARQFNASSEQQMNQFMESLSQSVKQRNADRLTAMSQFNAGQTNAMEQYTDQLRLQRDQFNAQNATAIEQSNVQWRRQTNQINTAAQNAVNQANAMNAFNLSNQALTFMWQEMRDAAKWTYEAAQNDAQRQAALAQAALGNEAAQSATTVSSLIDIGKAALTIWSELR